jgi:hypothetical protein
MELTPGGMRVRSVFEGTTEASAHLSDAERDKLRHEVDTTIDNWRVKLRTAFEAMRERFLRQFKPSGVCACMLACACACVCRTNKRVKSSTLDAFVAGRRVC